MVNTHLLEKEVQAFIELYEPGKITQLLLKKPIFEKVSNTELATQIMGRFKAKNKLPTWYHTHEIIYPPKLNLEQCSSEQTAAYKAGLFGGKTMADLTGGFGVDSYFFAKKFESVIYLEQDNYLKDVATHNASKLEAKGIKHYHDDALDWLKNTTNQLDLIYLDPARRDNVLNKVYKLHDCSPDILSIQEFLLAKSKIVMVKTSPLLDISEGLKTLKNVTEVHVIAVKNEVKELLWVLKRDTSNTLITTVNIKDNLIEKFSFSQEQEQGAQVPFHHPKAYLYEPNAALLKAGAYKILTEKFGVSKLHLHSHLYTSESKIPFPGRCFLVIATFNPSSTQMKKWYKKKANITTRNYPLSVAQIRSKYKINDGGQDYLFFSTDCNDRPLVIFGKKVEC